MKYLLYSMAGLLMLCRPVMADDRSDVAGLLKGKIDVVISLLRNKEMEKEVRNERIIETVTPIFDFKKMAKLSLGKRYWPGLSREKREEFSDLFIKRLKESYLEKLDLYSDEEVVYEDPKQVKKKIHVLTHLISKDNKIDMLYKFYKSKEGWKIYDVEVQGVSVIQTYRSQFHDVLKKGTIDDLLAKLQKTGEFTTPDVKKKSN